MLKGEPFYIKYGFKPKEEKDKIKLQNNKNKFNKAILNDNNLKILTYILKESIKEKEIKKINNYVNIINNIIKKINKKRDIPMKLSNFIQFMFDHHCNILIKIYHDIFTPLHI